MLRKTALHLANECLLGLRFSLSYIPRTIFFLEGCDHNTVYLECYFSCVSSYQYWSNSSSETSIYYNFVWGLIRWLHGSCYERESANSIDVRNEWAKLRRYSDVKQWRYPREIRERATQLVQDMDCAGIPISAQSQITSGYCLHEADVRCRFHVVLSMCITS